MNHKNKMEKQDNIDTLAIGETHPCSHSAMKSVGFFLTSEAIASTALSGNRLAEICFGTLHRIMKIEPVSDRYLLGLAWFLKELEEQRKENE